MAENAYQLVVRKGPRTGQIFSLTEDSIKLGRDPSSDIVINDAEVSRHHARLNWQEGRYWLQDMGSTNGSFVGGKRLGGEPLLLEPGQVIMFGTNVTLVYQVTTDVDPMATVIAPVGMLPVDESAEEPAEPAYAFEPEDELDVDDIIFEEPKDEAVVDDLVFEDQAFDAIADDAVADGAVSEEPFVDEMDLEEITFDDEIVFEDDIALEEEVAPEVEVVPEEDEDVVYAELVEELDELQLADEELVLGEFEDEEEEFATVLDAPADMPEEELIEEEPVVEEISFDDMIFEEPEVEEPAAAEESFEPISDGPAAVEPTFYEPAYEEPIIEEPSAEGAALDEADFFEAVDEMEEPEDLATILDASDSIPTFEPDSEQAPDVEPTPFPSFEPAEQEPAPEPEPGLFPSFESAEAESEPLYQKSPVEPAITPEFEPEAAFKPPPKTDERSDSGEPAQVAVPPSSPLPTEKEAGKSGGNQRIIIAAVVVLLLCCCLIIAAIGISAATGVFGNI